MCPYKSNGHLARKTFILAKISLAQHSVAGRMFDVYIRKLGQSRNMFISFISSSIQLAIYCQVYHKNITNHLYFHIMPNTIYLASKSRDYVYGQWNMHTTGIPMKVKRLFSYIWVPMGTGQLL